MQQEQDTCRICSGPGEPDQPLFYPCKCSGTIRYIHQDCLKTWLDHSKKSTCDVCKHPYAFTKVYAPDMPDRVPMTIIIRKFVEQIISVILFILRAMLVAFVWLTLLPYGTLLTWRLYFRMGDIIAWWISMHSRPASPSSHPTPNGTSQMPNTSMPVNGSTLLQQAISEISRQPYIRTLSADIFTGQIIASLIVLTFLAIFLLREWIQQNARPGVFDDGPLPEAALPANPQPQAELPNVAPVVENGNHELQNDENLPLVPAVPDAPAVPPMLPHRHVPDVPEDVRPGSVSSATSSDTEGPTQRPNFIVQAHSDRPLPDSVRQTYHIPNRSPRELPLGKRRLQDEDDVESYSRGRRVFERDETGVLRRQSRSRFAIRSFGKSRSNELDTLEAGSQSAEFNNRPPWEAGTDITVQDTPNFRQKRKAIDSDTEVDETQSSSRNPPPPPPSLVYPSFNFEFTFQAPRSLLNEPTNPNSFATSRGKEFAFETKARSSSQPSASSSSTLYSPPRFSQSSSHLPTFTGLDIQGKMKRPTPGLSSPQAAFNQRYSDGEEIAYDRSPSPSPSPLPDVWHRKVSTSSSSEPLGLTPPPSHLTLPRRPPLAISTVPANEQINAEASTSAASNYSVTAPLTSPRLAIYRPPEELGVGGEEYFADASDVKAKVNVTEDQKVAVTYTPDLEHHEIREHGVEYDGEEHDADDEEEEDDDDDTRFPYYFREPDQALPREAAPPLVPDSDDEDEDEDGHEHDEVPEGRANPQLDDAPLAGRGAAGQDADGEMGEDDRDQNLEEDLDGAMEAVGLRGPVFAVFQNAALMLCILIISIGIAVWVPFTLGKTIALLTLEPRRALQILHFPIRAVRFVTDPSVDAVIYCLRSFGTSLLSWSRNVMLFSIGSLIGKETHNWAIDLPGRMNIQHLLSLLPSSKRGTVPPHTLRDAGLWSFTGEKLLPYIHFPPKHVSVPFFALSISETTAFRYSEESFARLGKHVRIGFGAAITEWTDLAEGSGTIERLWAILIGYSIAAFLAALYLNTFTVGNVKSAGRAIRNAIRQQMIVLKVALFIVVELVMFPFGCGVMLDFSTLVLFPEATVATRVAFFFYAPVTAAFYHWLIGTMFMYQFAILLATCREILRPGCMWFIKDPQDPTFHPIRDILDRPTFAQLRKLCMSAMMYAVVISLTVGGMICSFRCLAPIVLPLRWKMREPLSEIPVDLLFVHLILPPTLHYFRPRKPVKRLMTAWWQYTARNLRLTSFMFGGRHPEEEFKPMGRPWHSIIFRNKKTADGERVREGSFRRAPGGDNIAFLRDKPALVEVGEDGEPLNENGQEIITAQNTEAQKAGRNYREDYTLVYVPPHFRWRIFLFILEFWLCSCTAGMMATALPIIAGRAVFALFTNREFHDGYSFVVGFYLLWWAYLVGSLFVKVRIRRQRHGSGYGSGRRIRAGWFLFLFKRITFYSSKILWLTIWLGIVLPTLLSIAVDLYLVIPLRHFLQPDFTPTIHIFESWATGLVISKIIIRTQAPRPGNDLIGALEAIRRNGWRRPDPWAATRDFIIPVATGLVGMILLPPLTVYGCSKIIILPAELEDLFRLIYPGIFVTVAVFQFAMSLVGVFSKWTQNIRDKEFLVELRLRNLDHPHKPESEEAEPAGLDFAIGRNEEDVHEEPEEDSN